MIPSLLVCGHRHTMLFALIGGLVAAGSSEAAYGNGIALVALVFCTASVSGGKLNPAVSFSLFLIDAYPLSVTVPKLLIEWLAQFFGAFAGSALVNALAQSPSLYTAVGANTTMAGYDFAANQCFQPDMIIQNAPGVQGMAVSGPSQGVVFGLEMFATLLLILTVLSTAVDITGSAFAGRPRFSDIAPLAIGLSLWAGAQAIGQWTGGALNPARFVGPALAGKCPGGTAWKYAGAYIGAHTAAAVVAAFIHALRAMVHDAYSGCKPPPLPMKQQRAKPARGKGVYDSLLTATEEGNDD